jgi:outer membrane cobalamin receptor
MVQNLNLFLKPFRKISLLFRIINYCLLFILAFVTSTLVAQTKDSSNTNMLEPSLTEIIGLRPTSNVAAKVSIANLNEIDANEAPSIITIITDEDIKELGYRDLLDIFNTIPGISIANDVQNATSIGIRGIWASEGRVLLMLNGLILNDLAYGSIILGHRFQVDNIKRIEFIRGAGSSMYGGLAALGVINIITKTGQEINGHKLIVAGGFSKKNLSRQTLSYNYGGALLKGIEFTGSAIVNAGNRSNEIRTLTDGRIVNFRDSSIINNVCIGLGLNYKKISFKQYYEDYNFQATYEPIASLIRTNISEISYLYKTKKITLIPFVNFKWQLPWNTQYGDPKIYNTLNLITKRQTIGFNGGANLLNNIIFSFGSQYYIDNYSEYRKSAPLKTGNFIESLIGFSAYAEAVLKTKYINFNLGTRIDKYAYFKPAILPRLSITKAFKKWYYKILYSQSFKVPPIQNINLDKFNDLMPETVTEVQAEVGVKLKKLEINLTYFSNVINKYIVFGYDSNFSESYQNSGNIFTNGIEISAKYKFKKISINSNYSYYGIISSSVPEIIVDNSNLSLGTFAMPKHKLVLGITYKIYKGNSVCINYIARTIKFNNEQLDAKTGEIGLVKYPATHNINLTYQLTGLLNNFLDIHFGIYNLNNTKISYLYTTAEGAPPVFGMGRELYINLKFNL